MTTVRAVVFFDVDGTLVPGTSASRHLAPRLGHQAELQAAEDAYDAGTLDSDGWGEVDARGWAGRTPAQVRGLLEDLPLVDGIAEVLAWLRERDVLPVLATLAWQPVGDLLCERFGFAGRCGPRVELVDGRYTGRVAEHLDEAGKRDAAVAVAAAHGLGIGDCAAVGDSRSDVPLFQVVGLPVSFNGDHLVRPLARAVVEGGDLRAVLPALSGWLAG